MQIQLVNMTSLQKYKKGVDPNRLVVMSPVDKCWTKSKLVFPSSSISSLSASKRMLESCVQVSKQRSSSVV